MSTIPSTRERIAAEIYESFPDRAMHDGDTLSWWSEDRRWRPSDRTQMACFDAADRVMEMLGATEEDVADTPERDDVDPAVPFYQYTGVERALSAYMTEVDRLEAKVVTLDAENVHWAEVTGRLRSDRYDLRVLLTEWYVFDMPHAEGCEAFWDGGYGEYIGCTCVLPSLRSRTAVALKSSPKESSDE